MLLLDNAPSHPTHLYDDHPNVKVVFLPPNTTSLLQPMDQGVIAAFKAYYLRRTFALALSKTDGDGAPTLRDFWKGYNILQAVRGITKSWEEVSKSCLNGVWKKLCPQFVEDFQSFAVTETLKRVNDDVVSIGRSLDLEVDEDDISQLLQSHAEELTCEDLVALHEESKEVTQQTSETPPKPRLTTKALTEFFHHIDAAMSIIETNDPNFERVTTFKRGLTNLVAGYKVIYKEAKREAVQPTLDSFFRKPKTPSSTSSASSDCATTSTSSAFSLSTFVSQSKPPERSVVTGALLFETDDVRNMSDSDPDNPATFSDFLQ